jgi:type II secretory pathway pseudopilin PulG
MKRGFTLIELCLGLVTTSLVMGAAAAFMMGVANTWTASANAQANVAASTQTTLKLQSFFRQSLAVGAADATTVLVWKSDNNADGKIQSSELSALAYDATSKTLLLQFPTVTGAGDATWTPMAFTAASALTTFRSLGKNSRMVLNRVTATNLAVLRPTGAIQRAIVEFDITTTRNSDSKRYYGSAALRTPVDPQ